MDLIIKRLNISQVIIIIIWREKQFRIPLMSERIKATVEVVFKLENFEPKDFPVFDQVGDILKRGES